MRTEGILLLGDEILQNPSQTVTASLVENYNLQILQLGTCLRKFQKEHSFGRAISAPQIGTPLRIIAIDLFANSSWTQQLCDQNLEHKQWIVEQHSKNHLLYIVNPIITWKSEEIRKIWDDCFSLPDLMIKVERFASISVEFETISMQEKNSEIKCSLNSNQKFKLLNCPFALSELLQHEIDHLEGILMIDRATKGKSIIYRDVYLQQQPFFDSQL